MAPKLQFCWIASDGMIFFQVLDAVFVSPGHRGRGYTAQLMERLLSEGKDLCLSYPGRAGTPPHLSSTSVVFSSTPFIAVSTSMLIVAIKLTAKRGMLRERICMLLVGKRVGKNFSYVPQLAYRTQV